MPCPKEYGEVGEVCVAKHIGDILSRNIVGREYLVCHLQTEGLHPSMWRYVETCAEVALEGR